jgi:hypothetical protein
MSMRCHTASLIYPRLTSSIKLGRLAILASAGDTLRLLQRKPESRPRHSQRAAVVLRLMMQAPIRRPDPIGAPIVPGPISLQDSGPAIGSLLVLALQRRSCCGEDRDIYRVLGQAPGAETPNALDKPSRNQS